MHFSNLLVVFAYAALSVASLLPKSDNRLRKWDTIAPEWDSSLPLGDSSAFSDNSNALLKRWEALAENSSAVIAHRLLRDKMIQSEESERQDAEFRKELSVSCTNADAIVRRVRQIETDTIWRQNGGFPGEMFALARDQIIKTKLYEIIRRMPKGALLHAHLAAMLPFSGLVNIVLDTAGIYFNVSNSLSTQQLREKAKMEFSYRGVLPFENVSVYSPDYNGQLVPAKEAAENFPALTGNLHGREGFVEFVKSKMVISKEESIHHELGVDQIWQRFQSLFDPAGSLFIYEPVVRQFWRRLFNDLATDGISWVEIRAGGSAGKMIPAENSHQDKEDPNFWWRVMWEELHSFKNSTNNTFHGARVIWSDYRGRPKQKIIESMQSALQRKNDSQIGELFSGYDLVGQEDISTLESWAPQLYAFQEEAERQNVIMPFFFHAGETIGDSNTTDSNLFDAIQLHTRRIGHGFSLYQHPKLIREVREKNILVEVCPISNEVLRLATDILHHPLPAMIAHGVPIAISNDDPAMLGQDMAGLTFDFYQVIQGFDSVGLAGLGALAQNSLLWSNFEDQDDETWQQHIQLGQNGTGIKADRIKHWNEQWEDYCKWVNDKFGPSLPRKL